MINGMSDVRAEVISFMENMPILERLQGEPWYKVEDGIVDLICNIIGKPETEIRTRHSSGECENAQPSDISKMTYSEFCEYYDGEGYDRFEHILACDEFGVYKDKETEKYYYLEGGENDASDFFEVKLIAGLTYSIEDESDATMANLFDCCCCGEYASDENIQYLWFDRVNKI